MITKIFGPPGTGKTTSLLNVVEEALSAGVAPDRIAYMAFTKKAANEAIGRATSRFNLTKDDLPWFRTLHSLAFKQCGFRRDDVMGERHYKELGYELGFEFSGIDDTSMLPAGTLMGDKVARVEALSRLRRVSLEQQWVDLSLKDLPFSACRQWLSGLRRYKESRGLVDFTDMLEGASEPLDVDVFILDEAQDLSQLQWDVFHTAAANAKHIYLAGDDDQCIYEWSGADPSFFLNHPGEVKILPQSFRIPRQIQGLASSVIERVSLRQPKAWMPRKSEGRVESLMYESSLDLSGGTWMLLARNRRQLLRYEEICKSQGFPYLKDGTHSTSGSTATAIISWERWRKGASLGTKSIKALGKFLPELQGWAPKGDYLLSQAPLPPNLADRPWFDVLDLPPARREYLRSVLANRESLTDLPRITISTIHQSKGGEADHVALLSDLSQQPWDNRNTDSEHRTLYVAITRARESLHIIQPRGPRYYSM